MACISAARSIEMFAGLQTLFPVGTIHVPLDELIVSTVSRRKSRVMGAPRTQAARAGASPQPPAKGILNRRGRGRFLPDRLAVF
jgi:hypothetical protein